MKNQITPIRKWRKNKIEEKFEWKTGIDENLNQNKKN